MPQAQSFRAHSANARANAARSALPFVRERHPRSAEAWDAMASQVELIHRLTDANLEGRIKYVYQRSRSAISWIGKSKLFYTFRLF